MLFLFFLLYNSIIFLHSTIYTYLMRYIEIIIALNLAVHILFIRIANYLLKQKNNKLLILFSSVIDIIYTLLYLLFPYELEVYKYIFILLISILPFIGKGLIKALLSMIIYFMLNFMLGGTSELIYNIISNFYAVLISLLIINVAFIIYAIYKRLNISLNNLNYDIIIKHNNKKLNLKGYCDTGNFLTTDNNIPVVFINQKIKIGKYKKNIIINSVSVKKEINLYEVESFLIKINNKYVKKDVYLAHADISCMVMFGLDILGG